MLFVFNEGVEVDDDVEVVWMVWRIVGILILNVCGKIINCYIVLWIKIVFSCKCYFGLSGMLVD